MLQWGESCPEATYRRLDGSLAFCDLSGFTAMSEKLASLGRLGAEELTEVLNVLFAALLDDAASYGGGLLKYGGDAVLLFFEGDDHAARAAAATHRMRATLRRLGRVHTSKGVVRVRMSVGVHTGSFDFFLVGDSHRELIVTGVGATTTCDMETAADAGEIMLSQATAAALPASCVGERKGEGFLLRRAPRTPAREPAAWGAVPDVDPLPFIPVGLHRHIGAVGADAEHRHVAVGFIAFGGVDDLLAASGGEHTAEVLQRFIASCQAAFDRYEVCFLYADIYGNGGKVFFTAGAPITHEDNEERLLRAALDINAADYPGLHLHTGLNRGYVFAGDVGATFRRTYTIIGDAVNTAARVMASCPVDGQIRAMPALVELASSRFATEAQAPFAAKGKAEPLTTVAVGQPLGPRSPDAPLPLVGRNDEYRWLQQFATRTAAGEGCLVGITGDAGVGKSRLVDEFARMCETEGFATLVTFAERYEQTTPFFVVTQLLRAIDAESEIFTEIDALAPSDDAYPQLLARAIVARLDDSIDGPALWVIDNSDLVDDASSQVLAAVSTTLRARPWIVVTAGRGLPANVEVDDAAHLTLAPLPATEAGELARRANPSLLPNDVRVVAERSGGNPLFIRQLVAALTSNRDLSESVESAVAARIDALHPRDRDVLRTAAVLGGRFEVSLLRDIVDGAALDIAALQDFVAVDGANVVFHQALYREVAYEGLPFRRRTALHLRIGRLLEATGASASRLSLHFHNGQAWPESWRYSREAADAARYSAAKAAAATLFERAVEAGRKTDGVSAAEVAAVAASWAQSLYLAGHTAPARRALALGRRLAEPGSLALAQLQLREAAIYHDNGDEARAVRWFRRGLATLGDAADERRDEQTLDTAVSLLVGLANCRLRQGHPDDALVLHDRAIGLVRDSEQWEIRSRVHSLGMLIAYTRGDLAGAIAEAEAAVDATRRDGRFSGSIAMVMANLCALKLMAGDWADAELLGVEATDIHLLMGNDALAATSQANTAELYIDQGRWDEAQALLDVCEPILAKTDEESAAFAALFRARLAIRRGTAADLAVTHTTGFGFEEAVVSVSIEAALAKGDADGAGLLLETAERDDVDLARRPAYEAAVAVLAGREPVDADDGDAFNAVLTRSLRGAGLDGDPDVARLGIVDVPVWAQPSLLRYRATC